MANVISKKQINGWVINEDDSMKMIKLEHISLVNHDEIGIELLQPYDRLLVQLINDERISNIENFINILMREIQISLEAEENPQNSINDSEQVEKFYQ